MKIARFMSGAKKVGSFHEAGAPDSNFPVISLEWQIDKQPRRSIQGVLWDFRAISDRWKGDCDEESQLNLTHFLFTQAIRNFCVLASATTSLTLPQYSKPPLRWIYAAWHGSKFELVITIGDDDDHEFRFHRLAVDDDSVVYHAVARGPATGKLVYQESVRADETNPVKIEFEMGKKEIVVRAAATTTLDRIYIDGFGGALTVSESDAKTLRLAFDVVRGPTAHTGKISTIASRAEDRATYTDAELPAEQRGEPPCEIRLVFIGNRVEVSAENTQYYHGARAYFDGVYYKKAAKL